VTTRSYSKRDIKENTIIEAAEHVFQRVGYANAKMEDIAEEAGISKGTVYFYFDTKDNLYMAVAYKGLSKLNTILRDVVNNHKNKKAKESVIAIMDAFFDFSINYPLYTEAFLDYMSIHRSSGHGKNVAKLTDALRESDYFKKLQDVHNVALKYTVSEIQRGKVDQSIATNVRPELLYLVAWGNCVGFIKLNAAAGRTATLHGIDIEAWRAKHLEIAEIILQT